MEEIAERQEVGLEVLDQETVRNIREIKELQQSGEVLPRGAPLARSDQPLKPHPQPELVNRR